jgi:hypothetical protein
MTTGSTSQTTLWAVKQHSPSRTPNVNLALAALAMTSATLAGLGTQASYEAWTPAPGSPTTSVTWARELLGNKFIIQKYEAVNEFLRASPQANVNVLDSIHRLIQAVFPEAGISYWTQTDLDTKLVNLHVDVDTYGLAFNTQVKREVSLHQQIAKIPGGLLAMEREIISVF